MLVDTHVHIPLMIDMKSGELTPECRTRIATIIREAAQQRVERLITISTSAYDSVQSVAIAQAFPEVYATIGLHPTDISSTWRDDMVLFTRMLTSEEQARRIVGIGECGIDLYHRHEGVASLSVQQDVFRVQIELALEFGLPVVIHSRDAADETLRCLDEYRTTSLAGIVHCFSYDASLAHEFMQRRFVLGIGGTVTYPKNEVLRAIVREIDASQFVFETDAPFLTPQPWRGTKNHPQYIAYVAQYCAQLRNVVEDDIVRTTTQTVKNIFTTLR